MSYYNWRLITLSHVKSLPNNLCIHFSSVVLSLCVRDCLLYCVGNGKFFHSRHWFIHSKSQSLQKASKGSDLRHVADLFKFLGLVKIQNIKKIISSYAKQFMHAQGYKLGANICKQKPNDCEIWLNFYEPTKLWTSKFITWHILHIKI